MYLFLAEIDELKGYIIILELARCIRVYLKKQKKSVRCLKVSAFSRNINKLHLGGNV
jgi:hypothetical protein